MRDVLRSNAGGAQGGLKVERGRAASVMDAITAMFPRFWSTSYQRTSLLRSEVPLAPSTATIHITDACPLKCSFCFAAKSERMERLSADELLSTLKMFSGVGRAIIIGGEPFYFPELPDVLSAAAGCAGEFEIFTNGVSLARDAGQVEMLSKSLAGAGSSLALTLPLDEYHREQIGRSEFEKIISTALELQSAGIAMVKFNLTDHEFYSGGYLNFQTARDLAEKYHPSLKKIYDDSFAVEKVDEVFYFNPVVGHGTGPGAGESLRGVDLVDYPEIVIGRRRGDGRIAVMKRLAALWMSPVPDLLVAGYPFETPVDSILIENVLSEVIDFESSPYLRSLALWLAEQSDEMRIAAIAEIENSRDEWLRDMLLPALESGDREGVASACAVEPLRRTLMSWKTSGDEIVNKRASKIYGIFSAGQQFPVSLEARPDAGGFSCDVLRRFLDFAFSAGGMEKCMESAARNIADRYRAGETPMQDGTMFYMGRMIDDKAPPRPLNEASLIVDRQASDERIYPVIPTVAATREDGISIELGRVVFLKQTAADPDAEYRTLAAMWSRLLNGDEWIVFKNALQKNGLPSIERAIEKDKNGLDDAAMIFEKVFYDSRLGDVDWSNRAARMLAAGLEGDNYSRESLDALKKEAANWERYYGKQSPPARKAGK